MLGVAFGVGYWGWDQAYNVLSPVFNGFPISAFAQNVGLPRHVLSYAPWVWGF